MPLLRLARIAVAQHAPPFGMRSGAAVLALDLGPSLTRRAAGPSAERSGLVRHVVLTAILNCSPFVIRYRRRRHPMVQDRHDTAPASNRPSRTRPRRCSSQLGLSATAGDQAVPLQAGDRCSTACRSAVKIPNAETREALRQAHERENLTGIRQSGRTSWPALRLIACACLDDEPLRARPRRAAETRQGRSTSCGRSSTGSWPMANRSTRVTGPIACQANGPVPGTVPYRTGQCSY